MEVEYIARKYAEYLGGINVERALEALNARGGEGARRMLGVDAEEDGVDQLECRRAVALAEFYRERAKELMELYQELLSSGLPPADLAALRRNIREVKKAANFYRDLMRRCVAAGQSRHRPQS
ncbi:MAG: hypothetical protein TU35_003105 [Thermoproteus sp. AZ2]|uniref:Uncharacterized protein n=1 Tax=Thermoproteus sp. AZ2 TaxID=1609232 RepID=A0ACC6UZR7_9CREN